MSASVAKKARGQSKYSKQLKTVWGRVGSGEVSGQRERSFNLERSNKKKTGVIIHGQFSIFFKLCFRESDVTIPDDDSYSRPRVFHQSKVPTQFFFLPKTKTLIIA